ncbi:hypothetical protein, partial [Bacillus cereus]
LGGGTEVCLPAASIQASSETYMGLVEVGVGLIPGGGGNKELYKTEDKEVASKENAKPEDAKTDPNSNPNNVEKKQSENKNQPV